jgi:uncharacterized membrane protein (UPF0127 family)
MPLMATSSDPSDPSSPPRWLVHDDRVLAALEVADDRRSRRRGLLGRDGIDGALLLRPARSVHTFGMRFPIDVAHLDGAGTIVHLCTMAPNRLGRPVWRARGVLECEAGSLSRWGLDVGDQVELR